MKFDQVLGTLKALKNCQRDPSILVIHCGGNDLGAVRVGPLWLLIIDTFSQIKQLFPQTTLVWSYILPRRVWRNAIDIEAIERAKDLKG
jgi:hypothetical protein